jgi:hypothetical protein
MSTPPVGVRPIVVSIERPSETATRLAPLPRCAMMMRDGRPSPSTDITYSYERP